MNIREDNRQPMKHTGSDTPSDSPQAGALSNVLHKLSASSYVFNTLQLIINSHSLVSITNRAGYIIYANDRFCEVSKYAREELIGQTHRIVRSNTHPQSFYEEIWSTISSGKSWNGNIQNRAKDGSHYWVISTITPIFDEKNRIVGYGSIRTDFTAQSQQISDLNDSNRKAYATLASAIDILDSSMLVVDASGHIVTTNQAYSAMYPESAAEERPGNHFSLLAKFQRPNFSDVELEEYTQKVFSTDTTEQHILADGRIVKIQRRIMPDGGFVSLHTDISDVLRQNKQLESQAAAMDLMKAIAVDANESADVETAYKRCLERICKYTGWEVGHVYLPCNDNSERYRPVDSWYCAENSNVTAFREKTENTLLDAGCGLPGRVFQNGEAAWIRDVTVDPNFPRADAAKASGIVGGAAFPIKIKNEVVATLEFYSTQSLEPSQQIIEILSHVCTQVGRVAERDRAEKTLMTRVAAELHQRDQKLVEQNERFDAALKNMSQGLCMYDKEQRLIVSNDRYAQMYDLPPEQLRPGVTLRQILEHRIANGIYAGDNPEEYLKEREKWVTSGIRSNKVQELSDGRFMSITHQPMPGGGWLTTHEDITERRRAEKALQESQELSSKAFRTSPAAIAITIPADGTYLDVNESWTTMLGYSHEEAMNNSSLKLGNWVSLEARVRFIEQLNAEGTVRGFETIFRTKNGNLIDVLVSGEQVEIGGEPRLLVVSHDITERKKAIEALRESEQRFKDIVEVSSDWIWECDENLRYTYLSERFTQITEQLREQFLGKTRQEIADNSGPEWEAHIKDLEERKPFRNFLCEITDDKGKHRYWMINGRPVFNTDGKFKGYRGTGSDRTEEVQAEAELVRHRDHLQELVEVATQDLKAKAEELNKALGKEKELNEIQRQFISMASHEFRTPLAIIDSSAQRLLRKVEILDPKDTAKRVEKIRSSVRRMTQLMERTLEAARIDEGKIKIEISECDLRFIILDMEMLQIELSPKHTISCDLKDLPDCIQGDKGALNQIFSNLISNAVKYSPNDPDIHVRGWTEGEFAVIEVKDNGLGIDEHDLPKMFQRFFRAQTSSGIAGTGIGLNLVKTLVELHDGSIHVQSVKNSGSVFTVRLPIEGPANVTIADSQAA